MGLQVKYVSVGQFRKLPSVFSMVPWKMVKNQKLAYESTLTVTCFQLEDTNVYIFL